MGKVGIGTGKQGGRRVKLAHLATVEDEDAVGIDDRVDSMRNCERGRIGELAADDILDDVVRLIHSVLKMCLITDPLVCVITLKSV